MLGDPSAVWYAVVGGVKHTNEPCQEPAIVSFSLRVLIAAGLVGGMVISSGCGNGGKAPPADSAKSQSTAQAAGPAPAGDRSAPPKKFQPVQLGGESAAEDAPAGPAGAAAPRAAISNEQQARAVLAALQPFQVMLGQWRWLTKKSFGDFPKTGEDLNWIWDFKSKLNQPALVFHSEKHPYFHSGRLTYLPDADQFELATESPEGGVRRFQGTWAPGGELTETVEGKKVERSFKLDLKQVEPAEGEQWRVVMNLQENNRYLIILTRKPAAGKTFATLDTVSQQRLGTSFAAVGIDNPGPKCIISGGLGSMQVTYKGKSYPVCCSGCAAAFNDDPERWLAKLAKDEAAKKKTDE